MSSVPRCAHCGEQCTDSSIDNRGHVFCCTGCRSVYDILQSNGMCDYYAVDAGPGVSQRGTRRDPSVYEMLDISAVAAEFTDYSSGTRTRVRLTLPGMHCASCVWLLEQLQQFDRGILSSRVDLIRRTIEVEYDNSMTSLKAVAILLSSLGYEPLLNREGTERQRDADQREATRRIYLRLGVAGFAAGNIMMISVARYLANGNNIDLSLERLFATLSIALSVPVYFYSAAPWLRSALISVRRGVVSLDVPVALGISTLFIRSIIDLVSGRSEGFLDSFAGLVFFLLIGKLFQQKAFEAVSFDRTVRSFFPLSVRRERRGREDVVPIDAIHTGDVMIVRNGEVIPADSVLMSDAGYVDYAFVTGESVPVECTSGSMIFAGGKVVGTALRLTATRPVSQSYLASLWERTSSRTPRTSYGKLSDRFGLWFTIGTLMTAIVGAGLWLPDVTLAMNVFTSVLIIACPCALTLATPITLGTAMGVLGRYGIYVKNVGVLLELKRVNTIVFDKTGTLATPLPDAVYTGRPLDALEQKAVRAIASNSAHPVSQSIASTTAPFESIECISERIGKGILGRYAGYEVAIGSWQYMNEVCSKVEVEETCDTFVSIDGTVVGAYKMRSCIHPDVASMISSLREEKITTKLVTGDTDRDAEMLSSIFPSSDMTFRAIPSEKVGSVDRLRNAGATVLMVGDGLNDISAMAAADVSIAVTNGTSTLAPASDVVMPADRLRDLPCLLGYSNDLGRVISASLWFTMAYNIAGLALALSGLLTPVLTAIMMPVSSLLVIGISVFGARILSQRFA
ncbi:MAG: heavy metal translocating P-type ATPase [Candidatus Kapabacteria bacterium]|nr:heavy metal translocating P-type ATPase [Candidatus Kapabacteria bacterium]